MGDSSESRNTILKKIRMALAKPTPLPYPQAEETKELPLQPQQDDPVLHFAEQFTALQGKFIFCVDEAEAQEQFSRLCHQNAWTKLYCAEPEWKGYIHPDSIYGDIATCEA